ncbi:MAG TPA: tetratricopeptide repeat protein, partial [Terriglobia bacterium]|nr:tetratricopeptide repeat protein [Terriglobia bacterium]
IALCLENLALLYASQGKHNQAELLYQRSRKIEAARAPNPLGSGFTVPVSELMKQTGKQPRESAFIRVR